MILARRYSTSLVVYATDWPVDCLAQWDLLRWAPPYSGQWARVFGPDSNNDLSTADFSLYKNVPARTLKRSQKETEEVDPVKMFDELLLHDRIRGGGTILSAVEFVDLDEEQRGSSTGMMEVITYWRSTLYQMLTLMTKKKNFIRMNLRNYLMLWDGTKTQSPSILATFRAVPARHRVRDKRTDIYLISKTAKQTLIKDFFRRTWMIFLTAIQVSRKKDR